MSLADEAEFDFDEWVDGSKHREKLGGHSFDAFAAAPSADTPNASSDDDSDSGGDDALDWEDAEEGAYDDVDAIGVQDRKMPARAVHIDFGADSTGEKTSEELVVSPTTKRNKHKRRNKLSNRFLPSEMREFLVNLSRAHLLCLTSALVSASRSCCTDADAIAIIASLAPHHFITLPAIPTVDNLRDFTSWLFPFLNDAAKTRNRRLWRNRSQGAPPVRQRRSTRPSEMSTPDLGADRDESLLISYAKFLAVQYDDNPQLFYTPPESESKLLSNQRVFFTLAMARSFQWRARLIQILDPVRPELDVDHPMLQSCADLFRKQSSACERESGAEPVAAAKSTSTDTSWIEVLCADPTAESRFRWVPVDPIRQLFDSPNGFRGIWIAVLKHRGVRVGKKSAVHDRMTWWARTIRKINVGQCNANGTTAAEAIALDGVLQESKEAVEVEMESAEREELDKLAEQEVVPTSKNAFQTHPVYVIPSVLGKTEVLAPDANKRVCGVFKGQLVYKRSDVSTALTAQKWLYQGRNVKANELGRPVKQVKARKKPSSKSFKPLKSYGVGSENDGSEQKRIRDLEAASSPLSDGMESLYAMWQTEPWSPSPVGPDDKIPLNEFRNIELALLNPGLVHIDQPGLAAIAKRLGIPYAPCLIGFEGHGGNRTPTIRGIVVHKHNKSLVREAAAEWQNHEAEVNDAKRRKTILSRWKRLMVGLLTKARLDREYGDKDGKEATK